MNTNGKTITASDMDELAALRAKLAQAEAERDAARQALSKKPVQGGKLTFYIANDGMPAGPGPDKAMLKGMTDDQKKAANKAFCKGTISVGGFNAVFPISGYREQWLRFTEGVIPSQEPEAAFLPRFRSWLESDECAKHYAVAAAHARKEGASA